MSQVPSRASIDARASRERVNRCPVCKQTDVSGLHVNRCEERERIWREAAKAIDAAGVPGATGHDLWAHLNTRHGSVVASQVTCLVLDLGWRPVVGSDAARIWSTPEPTERTAP